ncbi:hypothetical protein FQR65_LT11016 [Abscondita terminalis]|nr:hypothetical protein FQR65_LT11016 [Abscondita terminalis]
MYNSIAFIMFKRLQSVNNYLVKNETENPYDSDSILKALKFTSKVHYKISLIAKNFDNTFGWGIFTTISLSFFIVVLSIVLRGKLSELHPAQSSCLNGILMISSVIVVIICQKIKIETQKIRCSICWLTLPNFNKQLSDIVSISFSKLKLTLFLFATDYKSLVRVFICQFLLHQYDIF